MLKLSGTTTQGDYHLAFVKFNNINVVVTSLEIAGTHLISSAFGQVVSNQTQIKR